MCIGVPGEFGGGAFAAWMVRACFAGDDGMARALCPCVGSGGGDRMRRGRIGSRLRTWWLSAC